MGRILFVVFVAVFVVVLSAASSVAGSHDDPIVVIEVDDPIDQLAIDFIAGALSADSVHLFILKIDSPGVSSGDVAKLYDAVTQASAPVLSWIGPDPAVAYGGSAILAGLADIRSAAPGTQYGYLEPVVQRGKSSASDFGFETDPTLSDSAVTLGPGDTDTPGTIDRLDPALGQLIVSLDGTTVTRGEESWQIATAKTETINGEAVVVATRSVTFIKQRLLDRFLRLGARPETAFLFLLIGAAFAVFEFYAAGRGLMAAVASVSLIVAGYGIATLPMWWPGLGLVLAGLGVLVWGLSHNRVDWRAVLGTIMVLVGGMTFTSSAPAYPPSFPMVVIAVGAAVVFMWYSLTTVVRGRFATPTIGRENLLEKRCLVVVDLNPEGVVMVDGSRWRATADRGVVIGAGAACEIVGVTGLVLEVDPLQ